MLPTNTSWGRCVYCSSVNTCQLVYCLLINEVSVGLLFVSLRLTCFLHLRTMILRAVFQISSLHAWDACNLLDWVTCYPLHFILAYIVYQESLARQVVYIHVHYGVHGEMYIGIDSRLIDLSLCCIICSQIKKIWVLVAKPELLISCHPIDRQSAVFFPADHRDSTPWLENCPNERTI